MGFLFGGGNTQSQQRQAVSGLTLQTSAAGTAIAVVYGACRIAGNLIDYGDFQAIPHQSAPPSSGKASALGGGGKSGSGSTSYTYETGVLIGLCEGVINGIGAIYANKAVYFPGPAELGFTVFTGTEPQTPWGVWAAKFPGNSLGYSGISYVAADPLNLGTSSSLPNFGFEIYGVLVGSAPASLDGLDADPSLVIADMLTNPFYGAGFPAARLGSLSTYQAYCLASGLSISLALEAQQATSSILDNLAKNTNSAFVWSSGVLTLVPYGDQAISANGFTYTPPSAPIYDLTDDDFLPNTNATGASGLNQDPVLVSRKRPADNLNNIKVEFKDRTNQYATAIAEAVDQAEIDKYTRRTDGTRQAHCFADPNAANLSAWLQLGREQIRNIYQFTLGQRYILLDPMDIVTLTDARLQLSRQWVRITEITENDDGTLTVSAEEYLAGTASAAIYSFQSGSRFATNTNSTPSPTNAPVIFAAPVALAKTGLEIWIAVSGNGNWGGCDVWVSSDGSTYRHEIPILGGSRQGVLSAALPVAPDPDLADTLSVDLSMSEGELLSGTQADADSFHTLCYVDGELVSYETAGLTGANKYSLAYLRRGAYGSPIRGHAVGAPFARLDASVTAVPYTADQIGQTLHLKFPAFNIYGGAPENLSAVVDYPIVLSAPPVPPNVTNFSAAMNGEVVAFKWDPVADNAIAGYDIRAASLGVSDWHQMFPLTEVMKGTEMANASVPPGTWIFAIRARDVAQQLSPAMTTAVLQVVNTSLPIIAEPQAPAWGNLNVLG